MLHRRIKRTKNGILIGFCMLLASFTMHVVTAIADQGHTGYITSDGTVRTPISQRTFEGRWESMSSAERTKVQEQALWIARVLMSEDKREEPWTMMASIIINRTNMNYRGKTTTWGVIHDTSQFSAVGSDKWGEYKRLTLSSGNTLFNRAYEISLNVLVVGVPKRYKRITHAYYPETMKAVYGYERDHPDWDTPANPMDGRDRIAGWVYGTAP